MDDAPYDNVEFPPRKPGTGTWPGPGQQSSSSLAAKGLSVKTPGGIKLAPVMEGVENMESEDQRNQAKVVQSHGANMTPTTTFQSSYNKNTTHSSVTTTPTTPTSPNTPSPTKVTYQKNNTLKANMDDKMLVPQADLDYSFLAASSRGTVEDSYTKHKHFSLLNHRIHKQSELLTDVSKSKKHGKPGEILSYEQLIQGMLVDGEKLLLGSCWLHFQTVEFLEPEKHTAIKPPIGRGRICLTNKRMLLLSAENHITDVRLKEYGESKEKDGGYQLEASTYNSIYYQNFPLTSFHSAELRVEVGNCVESKIRSRKPCCCGLFSCIGYGECAQTWYVSPPMTAIFNRRELRLGVAMPPWHTKTTVIVHLQPELPVTTARDFVAQLQTHAPHMQ